MRLGDPGALAREWIINRHGLRRWLRGFDLVFDTRSGDSFADIYGLRRLASMSALTEFARRSGVPVVMGPQTIGPFESRRGSLIARHDLRRATQVMSRDSQSAAYATHLGRAPDRRSTDVVFAIDQPEPGLKRDVVLNISGLLWNPGRHVDSSAYRATVHSLYRGLVERGRSVSLLPHVLDSPLPDNDVPAVREFAAEFAPDAEVVVPSSLEDARSVLAGAEVVFGSRMHACLNAMSVGTPAIPLAYSRKFAPLLADLGWPHSVDLRTEAAPAVTALAMLDNADLHAGIERLREGARVALQEAESSLRALA
jgi:polysaccharide pyruvyl transferase WcaK-like protein